MRIEFSKRAAKSPIFRLVSGMRIIDESGSLVGFVQDNTLVFQKNFLECEKNPALLPDMADFATQHCILMLVREYSPPGSVITTWKYQNKWYCGTKRQSLSAHSEAEAILLILESCHAN